MVVIREKPASKRPRILVVVSPDPYIFICSLLIIWYCETKTDSSITTPELFTETCPYTCLFEKRNQG